MLSLFEVGSKLKVGLSLKTVHGYSLKKHESESLLYARQLKNYRQKVGLSQINSSDEQKNTLGIRKTSRLK
jgi:hypothetical protein